jgi:hypothetical protein
MEATRRIDPGFDEPPAQRQDRRVAAHGVALGGAGVVAGQLRRDRISTSRLIWLRSLAVALASADKKLPGLATVNTVCGVRASHEHLNSRIFFCCHAVRFALRLQRFRQRRELWCRRFADLALVDFEFRNVEILPTVDVDHGSFKVGVLFCAAIEGFTGAALSYRSTFPVD